MTERADENDRLVRQPVGLDYSIRPLPRPVAGADAVFGAEIMAE
jgi:hypothetical protein